MATEARPDDITSGAPARQAYENGAEDMPAGLFLQPRPTRARPLLGMTVLLVEDSRYSSEAVRLMCLHSGARIRRADCLASARRHIGTYRPTATIIDLGLPDGSGLELISDMAGAQPRVPIILGTSGAEREEAERSSKEAGADGFLPKPMTSLAAFQATLVALMPPTLRPSGVEAANLSEVVPDPIALREDLAHAKALLEGNAPPVGYLRRFLIGLARSAADTRLEGLANRMDGPSPDHETRHHLTRHLADRIATLPEPI